MQAFDALAESYDRAFSESHIARWLRDRVHERLNQHFGTGDWLLELGCGTGEDALRLAARGVRVLATDASSAMLRVAQAKCAGQPLAQFAQLDLRTISEHSPASYADVDTTFSGALSNFGALNCLEDWHPLAGWLAERVQPGGVVGLGVMAPRCAWELIWHGLHGDFTTATRRWRGAAPFQAHPDAPLRTIRYPSLRRLKQDFKPWFRPIHTMPLGLFLPPSDVYPVIEARERLMRMLIRLDAQALRWPLLAPFADHYWIEFRRNA